MTLTIADVRTLETRLVGLVSSIQSVVVSTSSCKDILYAYGGCPHGCFPFLAMVFAVLRICSGAKTPKNWFGRSVPDISLFLDVFGEFSSGNLDTGTPLPEEFTIAVNCVSIQKSSSALAVNLQSSSALAVNLQPSLGIYVEFQVSSAQSISKDVFSATDDDDDEDMTNSSGIKASSFAILMNLATEWMHLPPLLPATGTKVKNDIIELLQKSKVGWNTRNAFSTGMQYVNMLTGCTWSLNGHLETLVQRSCEIPTELKCPSRYNKPVKHNHRKRHAESLTHSPVSEHSAGLLNLTEMSYIKVEAWVRVHAVLLKLATNLCKYATYLEHQCEKVNHCTWRHW